MLKHDILQKMKTIKINYKMDEQALFCARQLITDVFLRLDQS